MPDPVKRRIDWDSILAPMRRQFEVARCSFVAHMDQLKAKARDLEVNK